MGFAAFLEIHQQARPVAKLTLKPLDDIFANFVTLLTSCRAERGDAIARAKAMLQHQVGNRALGDATGRAAPAGVDRRHHPGFGIGNQYGQTVSGLNAEQHIAQTSHHRIAFVTEAVRLLDGLDEAAVGRMRLPRGDDGRAFCADGFEKAAAIFGDIFRRVAFEVRQVQRLSGQGTGAAQSRAEGIGEARFFERFANNISNARHPIGCINVALAQAESVFRRFIKRLFFQRLRLRLVGKFFVHSESC